MKKILTVALIFASLFLFAENTLTIQPIKQEKIIIVTTTDFWFANSLHDSKFVIGYDKYEEDGKIYYELILNDTETTIMFLNSKIKLFQKENEKTFGN